MFLKKQRSLLTLFAVLVLLISSGAFIIASLSTYNKCRNYEIERIEELLEDAAVSSAKQVEHTVGQLLEETRETAYILSTSDLSEESVASCFAHQFDVTAAQTGLFFSFDGSLKYGNPEFEQIFGYIGKSTIEAQSAQVSNTALCKDGKTRFAVSVPFTSTDGKTEAVMLVYPVSVLSETADRTILEGEGRIALIHADGAFVEPNKPAPDWDFKLLKKEEFTNAAYGLSKVGETVFADSKYVLSRAVGINDWTIICGINNSYIDRHAKFYAAINRGTDIASLIIIVIFTLISVMYVSSRQRKLLFAKRRFKIAVSRSTRAVFQYDIRRDKFSIISQCCNINLPEEKRFIALPEFLKLVHPTDRREFQTTIGSLGKTGTVSATIRISQLSGAGDYRWYHIDATRLSYEGRGSSFVIGSIEDIDEREKERLILRIKATTDPLTGLYDRAETQIIVNERLSKLGANEFSTFCIIDLDNFKSINDRYGHECGDKALLFFAERLKSTFRFEDVIGRLGGDEFVVYMALTSDRQVIERRFAELMDSLSSGSKELGLPEISCSIGYITAKQGDSFQSVYRRADKAMYKAKTAGKRQAVGE